MGYTGDSPVRHRAIAGWKRWGVNDNENMARPTGSGMERNTLVVRSISILNPGCGYTNTTILHGAGAGSQGELRICCSRARA